MIQFVVFDLGGVLCDVDLTRGRRRCGELGYPLSVFEAVEDSGAKFEADRGRMTVSQMLDTVRSRCPAAEGLTESELRQMWGAIVSWRSYVPDILEGLRVPYGVLSVIDPIHAAALGDLPGASPCVYSCDIGHVKPDHAAYRELIAQSRRRPEHILFVDDRDENVAAARYCGLRAERVWDKASLVAALGSLLQQTS